MGSHKRFDDDDNEVEEIGNAQDLGATKSETAKGRDTAQHDRKPAKTLKKEKKGRGHNGTFKKPKALKGQIRGIERLLQHRGSSLSAKAKKAKEAQLEELKRMHKEHERREREKVMHEKYRMVKFFERRKLERIVQNIAQDGDKAEDAERKKQAIRDLQYVKEFPKDEKYIALFPKEGHTDESRRQIEEIRGRIESGEQSAVGAKADDAEGGDDFFLNDEEL